MKDLKVDFILLDLEMPIMNGYETCQKICQLYDKDKKFFEISQKVEIWKPIDERPLLVACTGFLNDEIERETLKAGFDVAI